MSLLELDHVAKRFRDGQREQIVLSDVNLHVRSGELVMVWGLRRSGLSTLLRIAAGIAAPDRGTRKTRTGRRARSDGAVRRASGLDPSRRQERWAEGASESSTGVVRFALAIGGCPGSVSTWYPRTNMSRSRRPRSRRPISRPDAKAANR
jgi:energy-coupling factor transporter ATP-binding protein EcfA2